MILIAMGSNMEGPFGPPEQALHTAVRGLEQDGIVIRAKASLYRSAPMGSQARNDFVNSVVRVRTHLPPRALLWRLKAIERRAGRRRSVRWSARPLDLDILAFHNIVYERGRESTMARPGRMVPLILPHPGIAQRPFVLEPLREIAPFWHHPLTGLTPAQMVQALPGRGEGHIRARLPWH